MPTPLQDIHRQAWCVRELQEEDLLARDVADTRRVVAAREDVEAVETGSEGGMVRVRHYLPRMTIGVDVRSPSQRLIRDPQSTRVRTFGKSVELSGEKT